MKRTHGPGTAWWGSVWTALRRLLNKGSMLEFWNWLDQTNFLELTFLAGSLR